MLSVRLHRSEASSNAREIPGSDLGEYVCGVEPSRARFQPRKTTIRGRQHSFLTNWIKPPGCIFGRPRPSRNHCSASEASSTKSFTAGGPHESDPLLRFRLSGRDFSRRTRAYLLLPSHVQCWPCPSHQCAKLSAVALAKPATLVQ